MLASGRWHALNARVPLICKILTHTIVQIGNLFGLKIWTVDTYVPRVHARAGNEKNQEPAIALYLDLVHNLVLCKVAATV